MTPVSSFLFSLQTHICRDPGPWPWNCSPLKILRKDVFGVASCPGKKSLNHRDFLRNLWKYPFDFLQNRMSSKKKSPSQNHPPHHPFFSTPEGWMEEFLQRLGHGGCALAKQNHRWGVSAGRGFLEVPDDISTWVIDKQEEVIPTGLCLGISKLAAYMTIFPSKDSFSHHEGWASTSPNYALRSYFSRRFCC